MIGLILPEKAGKRRFMRNISLNVKERKSQVNLLVGISRVRPGTCKQGSKILSDIKSSSTQVMKENWLNRSSTLLFAY